jgi:3-methyladenine DNA glycosylase/8-oxoguanine DNA glycosylase
MFGGLVDAVLFQNTAFRRAYAMRANLGAAFRDPFVAGGRVYRASPAYQQLAVAPLEAIRAAKLGYRDRYVKALAEAAVGSIDLEPLKRLPGDEARRELMRLPGVGPYSADLALIRAAGRRGHPCSWTSISRKVLRQLYFGGAPLPDDQLREFAQRARGVNRIARFSLSVPCLNPWYFGAILGSPFWRATR